MAEPVFYDIKRVHALGLEAGLSPGEVGVVLLDVPPPNRTWTNIPEIRAQAKRCGLEIDPAALDRWEELLRKEPRMEARDFTPGQPFR